MPPLSLHHQERELNLAIQCARWFKLLAMQAPIDDWAGQAVRGYKKIAYHTKDPSAGDMSDLLARLQATVGSWMGGQGKPLVDALHQLLSDAGVDNANFGGQNALQTLGLTGNFNLTNPGVVAALQSSTMFTAAQIDQTTQDQIGKALATGASQGLDMDATARLVRAQVGESWPDLSHGRARTIATTEVCRATSLTSQETYLKNGIGQQQWESSQDDKVCDACDEFNGQTVSTGGYDTFEAAGLSVRRPPAHPDCRCTLLPVISSHWTQPIKPWTGGEEGGAGDVWSQAIQKSLAQNFPEGTEVKLGPTVLHTEEDWVGPDGASLPKGMAGYYNPSDGSVHIDPDMARNLLQLVNDPDFLIKHPEYAKSTNYTYAIKALVHENIHAVNPVGVGYVGYGVGMEEGLTEDLALAQWKDCAVGMGIHLPDGASAEASGGIYAMYENDIARFAEQAIKATGETPTQVLVRWKVARDTHVLVRSDDIIRDALRGMGYAGAEIPGAVLELRAAMSMDFSPSRYDPYDSAVERWINGHKRKAGAPAEEGGLAEIMRLLFAADTAAMAKSVYERILQIIDENASNASLVTDARASLECALMLWSIMVGQE
jgi:SPP1 gp7 family putative phage head morphogenesis protein